MLPTVTFCGKPHNYYKIDNLVSRSAQPQYDDFQWLKDQGVTDILSFRTMSKDVIDFDEKELVQSLNMNYHSIPSITQSPQKELVYKFLDTVEKVKKQNGKIHIHCMHGADRTGMYSFIYKCIQNIGTEANNIKEMLVRGFNLYKYPHLIDWSKDFLKEYKLLKRK